MSGTSMSSANSKRGSNNKNGTGNANSKLGTDAGAETATGDLSRRRLLGGVGAAGAAGLVLGAAGGATGYAATRSDEPTALTTIGTARAMFHGKHQHRCVWL